jgi:hypothetical protein
MGGGRFVRVKPELRKQAMGELIVINDSCSSCGAACLASDNYCRNCGLPTVVPAYEYAKAELIDSQHALAVVPPYLSTATSWREHSPLFAVLDNRLLVVAILLCAGPIGLPALWFSHRFSRRCKIIATTGYLLFTVILPLAMAWYSLDVALRPIVDALSQLSSATGRLGQNP